MQSPRASFRRGWPSYLLLGLLSFACGELALRLCNRFQPSFVFYTSSYDRYRGHPGEAWFDFRLNSDGFLDTEFGPKQPGLHRIVVIGDSFAHGVVPYRYNFLTVAESELRQTRPDVELYNLGIPRIGPREYLRLLINEGLAYQPDTVLVTFFIGNDVRDAERDHEQRPLYEYSYVLSLLRYVFYIAPRSKGVDLPLDHREYVDGAKSIDDEGYRRAKRQAAEIFLDPRDELLRKIEISVHYLREMQRVCASRGARLLVAVLPDELQLYEPLRQRFLGEVRGADGVRLDVSLPNRLLGEALDADQIPHLDLLPVMRQAARNEALYKPNDTHWNIAGNALASREIAAFLRAAALGGGGVGAPAGAPNGTSSDSAGYAP